MLDPNKCWNLFTAFYSASCESVMVALEIPAEVFLTHHLQKTKQTKTKQQQKYPTKKPQQKNQSSKSTNKSQYHFYCMIAISMKLYDLNMFLKHACFCFVSV